MSFYLATGANPGNLGTGSWTMEKGASWIQPKIKPKRRPKKRRETVSEFLERLTSMSPSHRTNSFKAYISSLARLKDPEPVIGEILNHPLFKDASSHSNYKMRWVLKSAAREFGWKLSFDVASMLTLPDGNFSNTYANLYLIVKDPAGALDRLGARGLSTSMLKGAMGAVERDPNLVWDTAFMKRILQAFVGGKWSEIRGFSLDDERKKKKGFLEEAETNPWLADLVDQLRSQTP